MQRTSMIAVVFVLLAVCFSQIQGPQQARFWIGEVESESRARTASPTALPGMQISQPPWLPELAHLAERLNRIGFPQLPWGDMNLKLHTHQHLDILIHGKPVTVPANIGISSAPKFLSPLHTHDASGVIHVESPTIETFTLGELFDVWGVRFTSRCIGAFCAHGNDRLLVFLNGKLFKDNPRRLPLEWHQEIVVTFGRAKELPAPIPSSYKFPDGL